MEISCTKCGYKPCDRFPCDWKDHNGWSRCYSVKEHIQKIHIEGEQQYQQALRELPQWELFRKMRKRIGVERAWNYVFGK